MSQSSSLDGEGLRVLGDLLVELLLELILLSDLIVGSGVLGGISVDVVSELDDLGLVLNRCLPGSEGLDVSSPGLLHLSVGLWNSSSAFLHLGLSIQSGDLSQGVGGGLDEGRALRSSVSDSLEGHPGGSVNVESLEVVSLDKLHKRASLKVGGDVVKAVSVSLGSWAALEGGEAGVGSCDVFLKTLTIFSLQK